MKSGLIKVRENRLDLGISFELSPGFYICYRDVIKRIVYLVPNICGDVRVTQKRKGYRDERWVIQSAKLIRTLNSTLGVSPEDYIHVRISESGVVYFSKPQTED